MLITSVSGVGTHTSHPLCVTPGPWLQLGTSCHLLRSSPWSVLSQQWAHVQMAWTCIVLLIIELVGFRVPRQEGECLPRLRGSPEVMELCCPFGQDSGCVSWDPCQKWPHLPGLQTAGVYVSHLQILEVWDCEGWGYTLTCRVRGSVSLPPTSVRKGQVSLVCGCITPSSPSVLTQACSPLKAC